MLLHEASAWRECERSEPCDILPVWLLKALPVFGRGDEAAARLRSSATLANCKSNCRIKGKIFSAADAPYWLRSFGRILVLSDVAKATHPEVLI